MKTVSKTTLFDTACTFKLFMRISFILKISAFTLLISIAVGCQTASTITIKTNTERKSTPLASASNEYKIEGCTIPIPSEKTKFSSDVINMTTVDGKSIKITSTNYSPTGEFTFTPNQNVLEQYPYNLRHPGEVGAGVFSLRNIEELKVKEKTFGYNFTAREVLQKSNDNSTYAEPTLFTCFDFNGDGTFTYIDTFSNLSKTVPEWATK